MLRKLFGALKFKDMRRKVLIVAVILFIFRLLANIPIPGVNHDALAQFFGSNQFFGFLNIFSGGALSNLSVAMLGLGPYITGVIIMQLLTMIFPRLKEMYYEEGEAGKAKFNRYSRYLTVPLAASSGYGFLKLLSAQGIVQQFTASQTFVDVVVIAAGSMLLVWLGELIDEQKIGNGTSILIMAGILSGLPIAVRNALVSYQPNLLTAYIAFVVLALVVIAGIVMM